MIDAPPPKPIVMVIDDTPANLRLLAQMLAQVGYDVRVANSGEAGLRAAQAISPDLILLDVMMPGMDGYQACELLKADPSTHDIPVIFISALTQLESKMRGFTLGGADFITKPFQSEEVLARVRTHLSLRSLQRQLEQANAALQKQVVELERQNEELDAFAHMVAHDLKNPLNNIMGFSELLQRRANMDAQTVDNITRWIFEGGAKMNDIIDSLLLLSGVRRSDVTPVPLEMGRLVEAALRRLRFEIELNEAVVIVPPDWPKALGYAPWVEQVWSNYLSNAIKYGGVPPRLALSAAPLPGGRLVRFAVQDNGLGLTPDEMSQLFKPFARLHKNQASGHGLGLTIVERIVTKLGGSVGVESVPGNGSAFYFTLPAG